MFAFKCLSAVPCAEKTESDSIFYIGYAIINQYDRKMEEIYGSGEDTDAV